tara:strand:- start:424 stop:1281 length:858 start_codon:yes stop_codon:yes gene_type:complete
MKLFWNTNNQSSSFWGDYHQKNSKTWIYELLENIEFVEIDDLSKIDSNEKIIIVDSEVPNKQDFYLNTFKNFKNLYLIHLGDEGGREYNEVFYSNFKHVFRTFHLNKFSNNKKILSIPIGYKSGLKRINNQIIDKKYLWSFMGTIHGASRFDLIHQNKNIKPNFINITKKFGGENTMSSKDYYNVLNNCCFSLVPHGYLHPETYRLYESLECGSIPIIENPYNFFNNFLPNNPFYSITIWSEVKEIIEKLVSDENKINDVSASINKWWVDYKKKLKNHISKIIHV